MNKQNIGIILREQYFFRVNSNVAVAIILKAIAEKKSK